MHWQRDIELLTPTFCRGAYQDTPEIRVPSIRGMARWWFRALGGSADEEKQLFGGMKNFGERRKGDVMASSLVFRVSRLQVRRANPNPSALPHKQGGQGNPQAAFLAGGRFHLEVFSRFECIPSDLEAKVMNALETWLLLGALGLRGNRGGGSLWPVGNPVPQTPADLRARLNQLGCAWPVYLAGKEIGANIEQLRAAATDTVEEPRWLFGSARGGNRSASCLKLKIVRIEGGLRFMATAKEERIITEARKALQGHRSMPETWQQI